LSDVAQSQFWFHFTRFRLLKQASAASTTQP
jgi:hypothetical protein